MKKYIFITQLVIAISDATILITLYIKYFCVKNTGF